MSEQPGQVVVHQPSVLASAQIMGEEDFDRVWRMAKALAASGMFKDVTQAEQAFGRILLGADLGLTPTQALMSVDVVRGNVQVRAVRLAAWVRQHADYDYAVVEHDDTHCVIDFYYRGELAGRSSYSRAEADVAGLTKPSSKGEPSMYDKHPRNMYFSRAMSNGVKWFCPDVTNGIPVYTEADSFESSAVEIGAGEGTGEAPPWEGVSDEHIAAIESLMARAEAAGFPGLADVGTVRMRLNHQPAAAVKEWIDSGEEQVSQVESVRAEVAGEQTTLAGEGGEDRAA